MTAYNPNIATKTNASTLVKYENLLVSFQSETQNSSAGVFRQRSYDNLQNGKSPSIKSSLSSISNITNLNVTNPNQASNSNNNSSQIQHLQMSQSSSQYNNLSLSYVNLSQNTQPQLYHSATCNVNLSNFTPTFNNTSVSTNNVPNNSNTYQQIPRYLQPPPQQHNLPAVPIPTNFKYFSPQSKYNTYSESQNQLVPQVSPAVLQSQQSSEVQQRFQLQQQQQQQQINININFTLPRYPYHKNRAIGRKSSHDLQSHDQSNKLFYSNYPPYYNHSSTNSLNNSINSNAPPLHNNLLALTDSSSSSTTTISSSSTSTTSSLEQSNMLPSGGSSSYLNSYDTMSEQNPNSLPQTCPSSPRTRCASPSCSELDPMLQKSKHYHHKTYKLYKKQYQQQQQTGHVSPGITNPISPQPSFSQFSPSFWSANSNRSSVISTGTLGSIGYMSASGNGAGGGGVGTGSGSECNGTVVVGGGPYQNNYGGVGLGVGGSNSPYAQRRTNNADKQRFSNVYEYKFHNFDLNSIHEDTTNET